MLCLGTAVQLHAVTASVSGDRYFSNDVNHSMGPALIGEEIDDSVDLTPGDMFLHTVAYWGRCLQFLSWIHAFQFVYKKYAALPPDVEKWRRYVSHNLRRGVFVFSQYGCIIPSETDERSQTTAE